MVKHHTPQERVELTGPVSKFQNISKSEFLSYYTCPKQFYWQKVKGYGIPESMRDAVDRGSAVHLFYEDMYGCDGDHDKYTDPHEPHDGHVKVEPDINKITLKEDTLQDEMYQYMDSIKSVIKAEEHRLRMVQKRGLDLDRYFYPVAVEPRFDVDGMRGRPDAIFRQKPTEQSKHDEDHLVAFDLKSSLYRGFMHQFEVQFYAEMINRSDRFDERALAGSLLAFNNRKVKYYEFTDKDLIELRRKVKQVKKGIQNRQWSWDGDGKCRWEAWLKRDCDWHVGGPPEDAQQESDSLW